MLNLYYFFVLFFVFCFCFCFFFCFFFNGTQVLYTRVPLGIFFFFLVFPSIANFGFPSIATSVFFFFFF